MSLSGSQYQQLTKALIDAFPTHSRLRQMLRFRLNKHLDAIALGESLAEIVYKLVQAAEAEGWLSQLVIAARESNPNSPQLYAASQQLGLTSTTLPNQKLERVIRQHNSFLDIERWRSRLGEIEHQVCRIEIRLDAGKYTSFGTGFLLGPDVLITNYHVIEPVIKGSDRRSAGISPWAMPNDVTLRFDHIRLADGTTLHSGTEYHLAARNWLIDHSPISHWDTVPQPKGIPGPNELDYALLRIAGTPGNDPIGRSPEPGAAKRGWIEVPTEPYTFQPGTPLLIVQHPRGQPLKLAFDTDAIIDTNSNQSRVTYRANTEPGSSGSPCFDINWKLVALHHSGDPDYSLYHSPTYNQGIPLTAILTRLRKLGLDSELGSESAARQDTSSIVLDSSQPMNIFICYKHSADRDRTLASFLQESLASYGHHVSSNHTLESGEAGFKEIDKQIKTSNHVLLLLSRASADSEMMHAQVSRAYEYRRMQGRPQILPVRIAYQGPFPYAIDAFFNPLQYVIWQSSADDTRLLQEVLAALQGKLSDKTPIRSARNASGLTVSEDGRIVPHRDSIHPPLPEFDPRWIEELEAPGGAVRLSDRFYITRKADNDLSNEMARAGTVTTIRAARQTGKSSLLVRGIHQARAKGAHDVCLNMQRVDRDHLSSPNVFLRYLAEFIVSKLEISSRKVLDAWQSALGPQDKLTRLMQDHILSTTNAPIVLALDEVDRLLQTDWHSDFFALLRAWYESRALDERWNHLNIVMVISTEPYLLIDGDAQSPFNVGRKIYLTDFDTAQVRDLNMRHGSPINDKQIHECMDLLSGHPFLTRKALYVIVADGMTWSTVLDTADSKDGPFGDHLRRYHWLLKDEPDLRAELKMVIRHHTYQDEMACYRLLRAGLIKGSGNVYRCRCGLYKQYFEDKL